MQINFQQLRQPRIENTLKEFDVKFLILFGSYGKDSPSPISDVDLAVFFDSSLSGELRFRNRLRLIEKFSSFLGIQHLIDLVSLNDVPISLQFRIINEGKVIICFDELSLANFKEQTWNRYFDYKPLEDMYVKINLGLKN